MNEVKPNPDPEHLLATVSELRAQLANHEHVATQLHQALEVTTTTLHQVEGQLQAMLDAVPGGVSWINQDLEYLGINSRLAATYGLQPKDFIGKPIGFMETSPTFSNFVREFVAGEADTESHEIELPIQGERHYYLIIAQKYQAGQSALFVGIDITDRKRAEEQLFYAAYHDKLTGLANRARFIERLQQSLEYAKRHADYSFALLFLDLDNFKVMNDSLGHVAGDTLLVEVSQRLLASVRNVDCVARLGGDEFVALLDAVEEPSRAIYVAERIQRLMAAPFHVSKQEVFTTVSIGIALHTQDYQNAEDLLRDADIAMYRAKSKGRAGYEIFDRSMHLQVQERMAIETDLHKSLAQHGFTLAYEPMIDLASGVISGFEALVRWRRPLHGMVSPTDFIPVAEETGMVIALDRWVLEEACRRARIWQKSAPESAGLTVSVNFSSRQFSRPDLAAYVQSVLAQTNLEGRYLHLEITERAFLENGASVAATLDELKALGVQISIDDFGTGYSSLSYLHQFPLDILKVDQSFVSRLDSDHDTTHIVQAIITMAHGLGLKVVAEGVETEAQLARLKQLSADYAQGYLFSRPTDLPGVTALLKNGVQR